MSGHIPAYGLMLDRRFHITWITPELSRVVGLRAGDSVANSQDLPWVAIRHFIEAVERCLTTGHAVAWYEPGEEGGFAPSVTQIFPLPMKRGLVASFTPLPYGHPVPSNM